MPMGMGKGAMRGDGDGRDGEGGGDDGMWGFGVARMGMGSVWEW